MSFRSSPGEDTSSRYSWGMGSSRSSTGSMAWVMSTQSSMDTPPSLSMKMRKNQSAPSFTNCTSHRDSPSSWARGSAMSQTRWATPPFFFGASLIS